MSKVLSANASALRRQKRVRGKVSGTNERPRLSVTISNRHVYAQIIDDVRGLTLAYTSTIKQKIDHSLSKRAAWAGQDIAKKAKAAKIKQVVYDRRGRRYQVRVKAAADSARAEGLEF